MDWINRVNQSIERNVGRQLLVAAVANHRLDFQGGTGRWQMERKRVVVDVGDDDGKEKSNVQESDRCLVLLGITYRTRESENQLLNERMEALLPLPGWRPVIGIQRIPSGGGPGQSWAKPGGRWRLHRTGLGGQQTGTGQGPVDAMPRRQKAGRSFKGLSPSRNRVMTCNQTRPAARQSSIAYEPDGSSEPRER